ncbi:MAG TPA: hypothetical protein VHB48_05385 [Chitinophagaceae bacterium]|nr:hypothetical protein [Chitinophagaceae bacterium]
MKNISSIISSKTGNNEILDKLSQMPGTELNSILLELFRNRVEELTPADVLKQFSNNRFVTPPGIDVIEYKELETVWLKQVSAKGFHPVQLSPLAPLGTCASFKTIDQNNIVSALRGTEVMSDATNVFALLIAQQYKATKSRQSVKLATAERVVRAQGLAQPGHTAHFGIFCMATGGFNTGSFIFEVSCLIDHLSTHLALLSAALNNPPITVKILLKQHNELLQTAIQEALKDIPAVYPAEIIIQEQPNNYYGLVQFKTFLQYKSNEINLGDGGFVNWTQQLLSNKKHRLLISGIGLELVYKIAKGLI